MPKSYVVGPGREFNYPADELSLKLIKKSGGRQKLSEVDKGLVKYKTVLEGEDCTDMSLETRELYLERGWILEGPEIAEPKKSKKAGA